MSQSHKNSNINYDNFLEQKVSLADYYNINMVLTTIKNSFSEEKMNDSEKDVDKVEEISIKNNAAIVLFKIYDLFFLYRNKVLLLLKDDESNTLSNLKLPEEGAIARFNLLDLPIAMLQQISNDTHFSDVKKYITLVEQMKTLSMINGVPLNTKLDEANQNISLNQYSAECSCQNCLSGETPTSRVMRSGLIRLAFAALTSGLTIGVAACAGCCSVCSQDSATPNCMCQDLGRNLDPEAITDPWSYIINKSACASPCCKYDGDQCIIPSNAAGDPFGVFPDGEIINNVHNYALSNNFYTLVKASASSLIGCLPLIGDVYKNYKTLSGFESKRNQIELRQSEIDKIYSLGEYKEYTKDISQAPVIITSTFSSKKNQMNEKTPDISILTSSTPLLNSNANSEKSMLKDLSFFQPSDNIHDNPNVEYKRLGNG